MAAVVFAQCAAPPSPKTQTLRPDPLREKPAAQMYRQGLSLARAGDYMRAEEYLSAAKSRGYPEAEVIPQLLRVCFAASRIHAGLNYAKPYLKKHPRDWALRYLVASMLFAVTDYQAARRELEQVVHDAPKQPNAHFLLAVIFREHLSNPKKSEAHFHAYLTLAPQGQHAEEARAALEAMAFNVQGSAPALSQSNQAQDSQERSTTQSGPSQLPTDSSMSQGQNQTSSNPGLTHDSNQSGETQNDVAQSAPAPQRPIKTQPVRNAPVRTQPVQIAP